MSRHEPRPSTLWSYNRTRANQREIAGLFHDARRYGDAHPGIVVNPDADGSLIDRLSRLEQLEARLVARLGAEGGR